MERRSGEVKIVAKSKEEMVRAADSRAVGARDLCDKYSVKCLQDSLVLDESELFGTCNVKGVTPR
jgi:hypothetical protein